jgi:hypothetical protein
MNSNQQDQSYIEKKYFIDEYRYNCPFCNIRNVQYNVIRHMTFDWTAEKKCHIYLVRCSLCNHTSFHLSYDDFVYEFPHGRMLFDTATDIDSRIFYSQPTSFFVIDKRIPKIIRELITEAEGCSKMNFLTGASACVRKAIYEFLDIEKAQGADYEARIKFLKRKYEKTIDPNFFDTLAHIQDMTSDKVHEQSWAKLDSKHLKLIIETFKSILYEIYVLPKQKKDRSTEVQKLLEEFKGDKKSRTKPSCRNKS